MNYEEITEEFGSILGCISNQYIILVLATSDKSHPLTLFG